MGKIVHRRGPAGERFGGAALHEGTGRPLDPRGGIGRLDAAEGGFQLAQRGIGEADGIPGGLIRQHTDEPGSSLADGLHGLDLKLRLQISGDLVVQREDFLAEAGDIQHGAGRFDAADDGGGRRPGEFPQALDGDGAAQIQAAVGDDRGDDLAAQAVIGKRLAEAVDRAGEVAFEHFGKPRIIRQIGRDDIIEEDNLRPGEQHGQFRPGERAAFGAARLHLLGGGQAFERPV